MWEHTICAKVFDPYHQSFCVTIRIGRESQSTCSSSLYCS